MQVILYQNPRNMSLCLHTTGLLMVLMLNCQLDFEKLLKFNKVFQNYDYFWFAYQMANQSCNLGFH